MIRMSSIEKHSVWMFCSVMILPSSFNLIIFQIKTYEDDSKTVLNISSKGRLLRVRTSVRFMEISEEMMSKIIQSSNLKYTLHIDEKIFDLENVSIAKSKIPVRKPTTRGGVYFTDTTAYKIRAATGDMSLLSLLPKIMLGPNTEFKPVKVKTSLLSDSGKKDIVLVSHVANTVNTKTKV